MHRRSSLRSFIAFYQSLAVLIISIVGLILVMMGPASALVCPQASFLDEQLSPERAMAQARRQAKDDIAKIGIIFTGHPRQWQHQTDTYSIVYDYDVRRWIKGGPGPYAQISFGLMPGTPPPSDGVLSGALGDRPDKVHAAWLDRRNPSEVSGSLIVSGASNGCPRDIETAFDKRELAGKLPAVRAIWRVYRQTLEQEFTRIGRKRLR